MLKGCLNLGWAIRACRNSRKIQDKYKKYTKNTSIVHSFDKGGSVGEDTVPALLTPGEFVINKKAASRIGASKLHSMNQADRVTGYNKGGFVGFAKGGKARKDAATMSQATTLNPKAMSKMEKALLKFGATTEQTRAAMLGYAKSLIAGDTEQEAATRATASLNANMQKNGAGSVRDAKKGVQQSTQGFQEYRTKDSIVADRVAAGGLGSSGNDVARADKQTDIARGRLEATYGAKGGGASKASERALKVFRATLLKTNSTTQAMAAAQAAAVQSIKLSNAKTVTASKTLFPTFKKIGGLFTKFGTQIKRAGSALNRMSGGRLGKMGGRASSASRRN